MQEYQEFTDLLSSHHIRKLNEFFTIVIPAEAGIHSGKHDGFLPSQE
ncbi:hypothetical protein MNBD_CHLOROFLEXI01-1951 [hydrothermal vent metagenome]|uniref:Uncharacterized protein n=1 Tax=hydrothermal vent metagenome TaxID=652676 RepID=A0A3B0VK29_9ZZZZ